MWFYFQEIENRWQDDGTKGLPKGVIDSLQKVTPPNGLLSFERFCAGLKICLLRNQVESARPQGLQKPVSADGSGCSQPVRPPSAPLPDVDATTKMAWPPVNTATVRPNNAMPQQRTLSMPQLVGERKDAAKSVATVTKPAPYGPPKPPRTAAGLERASLAASAERNVDKAEIRTALQNWQMGLMMGDHQEANKRPVYPVLVDGRLAVRGGRSSGDGKPAGRFQVAPSNLIQLQRNNFLSTYSFLLLF